MARQAIGLLQPLWVPQPTRNDFLEGLVVHETGENFFVLVHSFHEQCFQQILEHELKLVTRIDSRRLLQGHIRDCRFDNLIEEQLVGLIEISAKTVVDDIDEPRQWNRFLMQHAGSDFRGTIEPVGLAIAQADRAFADLLQAIILKPHLVIELVRRPSAALRQLGREVPQENIQALKVRILIRNDLAVI